MQLVKLTRPTLIIYIVCVNSRKRLIRRNHQTLIIDNEPVVAEYLPPDYEDVGEMTDVVYDQPWYTTHLQEFQYFLQIAKCPDKACYEEILSEWVLSPWTSPSPSGQ